MTFEANVERLERIVQALEAEDVPLERALELFEEGIARLRDAVAELSRTEEAVKLLRRRADGAFETTDLDA